MSPEFCLRWNNHRPNLVNVFKELLQSGLLVDVTLAAGGEYIHAHRLVLSACSLYFKELFAVNPCQHPIVILKDFHIDDLKTVVDFIYQGEVNVAQERLPHVLKTAETLRIKGLAENPRSFEEFQAASAGQATTRLGSLSSNQQQSGSSLSDSREQSIEGEEGLQGDPTQHSTPPHKKRKVGGGYDHQSSEENEGIRVKEEPSNSSGVGGGGAGTGLDDTRQHQDDTGDEGATQTQSGCRLRDPSLLIAPSDGGDSSVAVSPPPGGGGGSPTPPPSLNNNGDTDGGAVGLLQQHHQGQGRPKRAVLTRQPGIIRDSSSVADKRKDERRRACEDDSALYSEYVIPPSLSVTSVQEDIDQSSDSHQHYEAELHSNYGTTLLQVPAVVVAPPREQVPSSSSSGPLPKQLSQPEISEGRSVVHQYGAQPPMMTRSLGSLGGMGSSSGYLQSQGGGQQQSQQQQQLHVMQLVVKPSGRGGSSSGGVTSASSSSLQAAQSQLANSLRKIQPKPLMEESRVKDEFYSRKEQPMYQQQQPPLIRLTPSDDPPAGTGNPPRLPRAFSEEPLLSRDLLSVGGPAPLQQSVSEDTGLDCGLPRSILPSTSTTPTTAHSSSSSTSSSSHFSTFSYSIPPTSGHRLALRDGPALGCNYCWNSTDDHGRIQRRKTKYHCPECRTNLCIVPCYQKYHKQMERADDTEKQITKILTKTSSL